MHPSLQLKTYGSTICLLFSTAATGSKKIDVFSHMETIELRILTTRFLGP